MLYNKPLQPFIQQTRMERTPTGPSQSETDDYEGDTNTSRRIIKRRALRSPELVNSFKIKSTLNTFKNDITEHMTRLFVDFQRSQDEKFTTLLTDVNTIKQEVTEIKKSNELNEKKIEVLTNQYEQVSIKTTKLSIDNEANCNKIKQLENQIEDLHRQTCSYKLEIRNIPSAAKESELDLQLVVLNLLKTLKIQTDHSDIRNARRLPGRPDTPRPIVIEVATMKLKRTILQEHRNFNKVHRTAKLCVSNLAIPGFENVSSPVFISEHLTNKTKGLFYKAREYAKNNNYAFCWTSNGQVLLREQEGSKSIVIREEAQLLALERGA